MSWLSFLSRRSKAPVSAKETYFSLHGPIASLKPETSKLPPRAKTPSSDCISPAEADPIVEALRNATFADPTVTYGRLSSDDAPRFLRTLLKDPPPRVEEVRLHCSRAGNFPCVIVELPTPQAAGMPHFAGVLVTLSARVMPDRITPEQVRYFTLEKRSDDPEDPSTVFCEWTAKGARRSFGSGPAPRVERFLYALSGMAR